VNTVQIIQLAGTVVFAICAIVVGAQAQRSAKQAQDAARRAETALAAITELRRPEP
jgi:hypothetical protein